MAFFSNRTYIELNSELKIGMTTLNTLVMVTIIMHTAFSLTGCLRSKDFQRSHIKLVFSLSLGSFLMGLFLALFIISGNLLVIITISRSRYLWSFTSKFVVNLAIADLALGLCLPYEALVILLPGLQFNRLGCLYSFCVIIFSSTASLLCLVITVFDRFLFVCYPFQYIIVMSNRLIYSLIALSWVYAFVLSHLPIFGWNAWQVGTQVLCFYQQAMTKTYIMIVALHFVVLSIVMFVLYALILQTARKQRRRIAAEQAQGRIQEPATNSEFLKNANSAKLMAVVFLCFSICWLPFCAIQLCLIVQLDFNVSIIGQFSVFLGIANSAMNPLIYAWKNQAYRQAFYHQICHRVSRRTFTPAVLQLTHHPQPSPNK
ncbi:adenosine receptor A3-like [Liolophura sinensis]|uniref:adenosine receptor A3-like n=1 Tax=Liolophura sinensis TaxID=3198878 RepID=UPI003159589C